MENTVTEVALNWIFQAIAADRYAPLYKLGLREEDIVSFQQMTYRQCRKLSHHSERFITIAINREQFLRAVSEAERAGGGAGGGGGRGAGAPRARGRRL